MRSTDYFHTADGVPTRRLPNPGRPKPFTDERIDQLADWLAEHEVGSRNQPAMLLATRHGAVTSL